MDWQKERHLDWQMGLQLVPQKEKHLERQKD